MLYTSMQIFVFMLKCRDIEHNIQGGNFDMLYTGMQIFVFVLKCRDIEHFFWLNSDHIVVV